MLYRLLFRVVLTRMDAERAHALGAVVLRVVGSVWPLRALMAGLLRPRGEGLRVSAMGLEFPSPVGVAAGLDKDGRLASGLGALGFGFVEVGTVTARAQPGNPRPRVWRLREDAALLNSMGFPSEGAAAVATRLARVRRAVGVPVGVNVGASRAALEAGLERDDYLESVRALAPVADFLVVNVSSPNTPGLRGLQRPDELTPLLKAIAAELRTLARPVPLLVKIAPDLDNDELGELCDVARELELDGVVVVNTTTSHAGLSDASRAIADRLGGGVSGPPLASRSLEVLRYVRGRLGDGPVVISVGGVADAAEARARLEAGATLVQAYTAFVYRGPLFCVRINRALRRAAPPASPDV